MLSMIKICSGNLKYVPNGELYNGLEKKNILFTIFAFIFAWMILYSLVNGVLGQSLPLFLPLYFSAIYVLFLIWMTSDTKKLCGDLNFAAIILLVLLFVSIVSIIFRENVLTNDSFKLAIKTLLFSLMTVFIPRKLLIYSHHMLRNITTLISPFLALYIAYMIFLGNALSFGIALMENYNIVAFSSLIIAYLIRCRYLVIQFIMRVPFFVYAILSGSRKFAVLGVICIFYDLVSMIIKRGRVNSLLVVTLVFLVVVNIISIPTNLTDKNLNWESFFNRLSRVENPADKRLDRINYHLNNINNAPFLGTGDVSYSAHNIIIQAWSEGGLIHALSSLFVVMLLVLMLFHSNISIRPYIIINMAFLLLGDHYFWDRLITLYLFLYLPIHLGKAGSLVIPPTAETVANFERDV